MKNLGIIFLSIIFLGPLCGIANPADLIFSDDFNRAEIGSNWITGAAPPECGNDTIAIIDGRVQATDNCNYIETTQVFSGNVRIEFDVEKIGPAINLCSDFWVILGGKQIGVIRFDQDDVDGIAIFTPTNWGCEVHESIDGSGPNKGKAIYTLRDGILNFEFVNENLEVIFSISSYLEDFGPGSLIINIAGMADSPRYIDNVKVYSLPTFPISDLNKDGDVDGTDLEKFAEDFGFNAAE